MPDKSKAQQRFMFAAEKRGEVPKGTAERWARETPNLKSLPEYVRNPKGGSTRRGPAKGTRRTYSNSMR